MLGSVAGPVIQAYVRLEFEDILRTAGNMIIYAWLRLAKIIYFRGLIKYLAHNHPHIDNLNALNFPTNSCFQ